MRIFSQLGKEEAKIALKSRHEKTTVDASWTQFGAAWPSAASVQQNARRAAKPVVAVARTVRATLHTLRKENYISVCGGCYEVQK